jgi:predicted enzyme related to lactoylglutathione lyase
MVLALSAAGGATPTTNGLAKAPVYFAISVPDLGASVKWYAENLGLTASVLLDGGPSKVAILQGEGLLVEIVQPPNASAEAKGPGPDEIHLRRGLFKVGFYVKDLDATVAHLQKKGVRLLGSAFSDEKLGLRSILILDNNENIIQLFEVFPKRE